MTTTQRRWVPKETIPKLKNTLKSSDITAVDTCLKALRKTRRSLSATIVCYATETDILKTVYYKSKNQHKNALFWRNVAEIRRFATRIEEANLATLLDTIRTAFYSEEVATNSKLKTAPWSQMPGPRYLEGALDRLRNLALLYSKAFKAYPSASNAFSRFSHSTAFLPLVVTLLGTTSRFHALTIDLDHALRDIWTNIHQLLKETEPSHQACRCHLPPAVYQFDLGLAQEEEQPTQVHAMEVDLGEVVARRPIAETLLEETNEPTVVTLEQTQAMLIDEVALGDEETIQFEAVPPIIRTAVVEATATTAAVVPAKASVHLTKKKKNKHRDEIDDIFG